MLDVESGRDGREEGGEPRRTAHDSNNQRCPTWLCCLSRFRRPQVSEGHTLIISLLEAYLSVANAFDEHEFQLDSLAGWIFGISATMEVYAFLFAALVMILRVFEWKHIKEQYLGSGGSPILMVWEAQEAEKAKKGKKAEEAKKSDEAEAKDETKEESSLDKDSKNLMSAAVNVGFAMQTVVIWYCLWVFRAVSFGASGPDIARWVGLATIYPVIFSFVFVFGKDMVKCIEDQRGELSVENTWLRNALGYFASFMRILCYVFLHYKLLFLAPLVVEIFESVLILVQWRTSTASPGSVVLAVVDLLLVAGAVPSVFWFLIYPAVKKTRNIIRHPSVLVLRQRVSDTFAGVRKRQGSGSAGGCETGRTTT